MNVKIIVGAIVIVAGIVLSAVNFVQSNVEYGDFATAAQTGKKIQVKGEWVRDMESRFDAEKAQFSFYLKDDNNKVVRVVLEGARPNNFELATSVVAKGRMAGAEFHATEVLTKCPSKYEGNAEAVKKTL
ncbi:MAG: cytochrome c maturation protein CcmE [Ignavibacteriales bacterium]|nr:cytochrome c maturation protein CcmE [Ignavibacteriales bacterium]